MWSFLKEIKTSLPKILAELLSDLCMGEMGMFLCVENACITQQFEVQQKNVVPLLISTV